MAKNLLVGVGSKARKVKALYVGVGGKARKVKKVYVGVGGKARLVYQSYVAVTGIDLILPDNITQPTVTITAVFTPSDATDQKVTWKFGGINGAYMDGVYMDVVHTTDTSCSIKSKNAYINSFLTITATASNGVTVTKTLVHTSVSLGMPNGTWKWD